MRGKREKIAAGLSACGLLALLEKRTVWRRPLIILAYHGVRDVVPSDYPFDEGTISASREQFDLQMNFVRKNFDVITFEQLKECREGKRALPKRPLMITFDDGFADNYQNAFPILRKYDLPATIFLVTGLVGTHQIFWWEKVVYWHKRVPRFWEVWRGLGHPVPSLPDQTQRGILRYLKDLEDARRVRILTEMEKEFPKVESEPFFSLIRPLQWDEVKKMSAEGIEFGAHTVTHPILSQVSEEKLRFELQTSKKTIEAELGKEICAFAYPVGSPADYNDKVVLELKQAGYRFGVTYSPVGVNSRSFPDPYRMKRMSVEGDHSLNRMRCRLLFSGFFF